MPSGTARGDHVCSVRILPATFFSDLLYNCLISGVSYGESMMVCRKYAALAESVTTRETIQVWAHSLSVQIPWLDARKVGVVRLLRDLVET
jgi:hypothetical protein